MKKQFTRSAIILHWIIAVSTIFLFVSSWWMLALPYNEFRVFPFQLHKNVGLTLALLLSLLLYVRLQHKPDPIQSPAYTQWMHKLASFTHIALYVLIFVGCISGFMSSSFSGWGTTIWWAIELSEWGWEDRELNELFSTVHLWTCWALLAVIILHVAGAVYHAFRRDGVVDRMLHL